MRKKCVDVNLILLGLKSYNDLTCQQCILYRTLLHNLFSYLPFVISSNKSNMAGTILTVSGSISVGDRTRYCTEDISSASVSITKSMSRTARHYTRGGGDHHYDGCEGDSAVSVSDMYGRHVQKTPFFRDPHARLTKGGL